MSAAASSLSLRLKHDLSGSTVSGPAIPQHGWRQLLPATQQQQH